MVSKSFFGSILQPCTWVFKLGKENILQTHSEFFFHKKLTFAQRKNFPVNKSIEMSHKMRQIVLFDAARLFTHICRLCAYHDNSLQNVCKRLQKCKPFQNINCDFFWKWIMILQLCCQKMCIHHSKWLDIKGTFTKCLLYAKMIALNMVRMCTP